LKHNENSKYLESDIGEASMTKHEAFTSKSLTKSAILTTKCQFIIFLVIKYVKRIKVLNNIYCGICIKQLRIEYEGISIVNN